MLKEILNKSDQLQPGLSIDCVIFGFHNNQLKVLLLKSRSKNKWSLPGGFIDLTEDIDHAAINVLKWRTGLEGIFLRQFASFGKVNRTDKALNKEILRYYGLSDEEGKWFLQRFVSIGYYALVEYQKTIPNSNNNQEVIEWIDLSSFPELVLDHQEILEMALKTLRNDLNLMPIGLNLLPEKFTMPELQKLYETILDRPLDRRNFLRKMTATGILIKLEEKKTNVAHKAPNYYQFDVQKYNQVLAEGLNQGW